MTLVIIPARMGSTRLPGKPLLKIGDKTIIERCVLQAKKAGFLPVVATDSLEILDHESIDHVILTPECATGTDRVAWAAEKLDPEGKHEFVINYQGDMPFLDPEDLADFVAHREQSKADVVTAYTIEKVVIVGVGDFTRRTYTPHIGLYGYTREALRKFAAIPQSPREKEESLEQLRANDVFRWELYLFHSMPIEINTQADLDRARSCLM